MVVFFTKYLEGLEMIFLNKYEPKTPEKNIFRKEKLKFSLQLDLETVQFNVQYFVLFGFFLLNVKCSVFSMDQNNVCTACNIKLKIVTYKKENYM